MATMLVVTAVASVLGFATSTANAAPAPPVCEELVSRTPAGTAGDAGSRDQVYITPDGRYVAFSSTANNLVPNDTASGEFLTDVFVRDTATGTTELVNRSSAGQQDPLYGARAVGISNDGRYVAFWSGSSSLVPGDTNDAIDTFVRDRATNSTTRVSVGPGGAQLTEGGRSQMSADGRYFVLNTTQSLVPSDTNGVGDVYRYDRLTQTVDLVSVADDETLFDRDSFWPTMDGTGTVFAFTTTASIPGNPNTYKLMLRDMGAGTTTFVAASFLAGSKLSGDGKILTFPTYESFDGPDTENGPDVYAFDRVQNSYQRLRPVGVIVWNPEPEGMSPDGRFVTLRNNAGSDSYLFDRNTSTSTYLGINDGATVTADGTRVAMNLDRGGSQTYVAIPRRPVIQSVTPSTMNAGAPVTLTITGDNLTHGDGYDLGTGVTVSGPTVSGDRSITVQVSANASTPNGPHALTVTLANGCRTTLPSAITVQGGLDLAATAVVTAVSPEVLRPGRSTDVIVTGSGFENGAVVAFDPPMPVNATTFISSGMLAVTVTPPTTGALGYHDVHVTNPGQATTTFTDVVVVRDVAGEFHALQPARILDTRPRGKVGPGQVLSVPVTGVGGVPSFGVQAVVLNVTATNPSASSYLTLWPSGAPIPNASNLNFVEGQTVANLVTATVGDDGRVSIYNFNGTTDVLFDVVGWYSSEQGPPGGAFVALPPTRVLDTRSTGDGPLGEAEYLSVAVAPPGAGVAAVMVNLTVTEPSLGGYLVTWPDGAPIPDTSSVNFVAAKTVANLAIVKVGDNGTFDIGNRFGTAHVIVDVLGVFADGSVAVDGGLYEAVTPFRALDTRVGIGVPVAPVGPGATIALDTVAAGVPLDATAVVMNLTATNATAGGFLTVFPSGMALPNASNVNFLAGQTVPNMVAVPIGADGRVLINNAFGNTDVIADITGWYR
jgi:hypothetical protein